MKRDKIEVPAELFVRLVSCALINARPEGNLHKAAQEAQTYTKLCLTPRLFIKGTRWHNSRTGTGYFKFYVSANGELVYESEQRNGHGQQPLYDAMKWLEVNNPDWVPDWVPGDNPTIYLREHQHDYMIADVTKERNL